ncbi:pyroglutamyl-peptidase I [Acinetobacter lactucae]|uniref:pyroglutamyl-peptidase I n=1 Tax=Acinetobacter lactucae TaxID=1785128 RepID=UPI00077E2CE4|nr:pyroglutamyl-peptidase I [Acinetobacter lactucae]
MNILITGFEPFQQDKINPSWEIAKALHGFELFDSHLRPYYVCAVCLPVVFGESAQVLQQAIYRLQPDYVLCLGVATNRCAISLERIAINIDDAQIVDNSGHQPIDQFIDIEGSPAFFSTLPIKTIFQKLQQENIAVEVSNSAGTYVCNHIFYRLMSLIQNTHIKGGFIHVPALPEMLEKTNVKGMDLDTQIRSIRMAIEVTIQTQSDVDTKVITGKIS